MTDPLLTDRMVASLESLRLLLREYHLASPDEQKAVRHALYQKHGNFGKLLKESIFDKFKVMEADYDMKKAADTMNNPV